MALHEVLSRSNGLVPVVVASSGNNFNVKRAVSVQYMTTGAKLRPVQHLILRMDRLSSSTCNFDHRGPFEPSSQPRRLQVTSQAVATNNDASSGDFIGSSAHAINLSSGAENLKSFLQEGLGKLKEGGLLQTANEGLHESYAKLRSIDGKKMFESTLSKLGRQGARSWQSLEPWTKWPLAIFATVYLVILIAFGAEVVQDLIPLWVLGPLFTGLTIRSVYWACDFTRRTVMRIEPLREAAISGTIQLYNDAKSGELFDKVRTLIALKRKQLKEDLAKKRSDLVLYVKSGQAGTDLKNLLLVTMSLLNEWSTEKYENFVEAVRPFWRGFTRLMKKLF